MEQFEITAEARELKGKGASRRLRRTGYIPAIVYGAGQEPVNIQLEHNDVLKHTEHEAFYSHILSLKLPTGTERVVLKDMQRHPYKALVLHMDFLRVNEKEKLTMRVPLHFINEETSLGVKSGGVVSHVITELEVLCLPRDLPEYIEVDVANMNLGDTLHLSDITVPSGVEIASLLHGGDDALPVVSIQLPKGGADDAAEASEEQANEDTDSTA
jgi:large subunit ribosomal protein L25